MNYLRPGSKKNLLVHIRTFLSFCLYYRIPDDSLDVNLLCAYIEFLLNSFRAPSTVRNYISSLATFQSWRGLTTEIFDSLQVSQLWKAIMLTVRHFPRQVHILSIAQLKILLRHAALLGTNYLLFKAFLTLLFFSMVRVSTLIPYSSTQFDKSRHMCVNDLKRTDFGYMVNIKWAKNVQNPKSAYVLPILENSDPELCPVKALDNYLETVPNSSLNRPLFMVAGKSPCVLFTPLNVRQAYEWLHAICAASPLAGLRVTFYSFRKSACSQAYRLGAQINDLKYFGAWRSAALFRYLEESPAKLRVAKLLSNMH